MNWFRWRTKEARHHLEALELWHNCWWHWRRLRMSRRRKMSPAERRAWFRTNARSLRND